VSNNADRPMDRRALLGNLAFGTRALSRATAAQISRLVARIGMPVGVIVAAGSALPALKHATSTGR
jgi:hypothetical protein